MTEIAFFVMPGTYNEEQVKKQFAAEQQRLSLRLKNCTGVDVRHDREFNSHELAKQYLEEVTIANGQAVAVKYATTSTRLVKLPTFGRGSVKLPSVVKPMAYVLVDGIFLTADGLTKPRAARLTKLYETFHHLRELDAKAAKAFNALVFDLTNIQTTFDAYGKLKTARKNYLKAHRAYLAAHSRLDAFDASIAPKLYKYEETTLPANWLVAGRYSTNH